MPSCNKKYLGRTKGDDGEDGVMELKCPEEGYVKGESVTVEEIETDGAFILTTPYGQAELVFPVTCIQGDRLYSSGRSLSISKISVLHSRSILGK